MLLLRQSSNNSHTLSKPYLRLSAFICGFILLSEPFFSLAVKAKLANHETINVTLLPKSTYHVQAIFVDQKTQSIKAQLVSIPMSAGV